MLKYFVIIALLFPALTLAQTNTTGSLQQLLDGLGGFLNSIVIPFILAIAFIVFVVNAVRYFVIGGATDEGQKNAKNLALYGIGAFVFILSFWGIVNLVVNGIGLENEPCEDTSLSDYIKRQAEPCGSSTPIPTEPPPTPVEPPPTPINPPPGEDDIEQILSEIKAAMQNSLNTLEGLYGSLVNYVSSDLFAEFLANQQMVRQEEAEAILRAAILEMIPFSTQERFFNAWLEEQINDGTLNPIDEDDVRNDLPRALPPEITEQINTTKQFIETQLNKYLENDSFGARLTIPGQTGNATPRDVVDYLFNQEIPMAERESYLVEILDIRYFWSTDELIDISEEMYNSFIDTNNAITTYNASFDVIDERDPNYIGPR